MKNYFIAIFCIVSFFCYGQKNETIIHISNYCHAELSVFSKMKSENPKSDYSLTVKLLDFGRYDFRKKIEAKLVGLPNEYYGTGIWFSVKKNNLKEYYYPVSENFMENGFSEIYQDLKGAKRVKLYFRLYETDANPIVIIDRIKVLD